MFYNVIGPIFFNSVSKDWKYSNLYFIQRLNIAILKDHLPLYK